MSSGSALPACTYSAARMRTSACSLATFMASRRE
eukprot:CAMPEP_0115699316 /NCGR_PEP_ID=MMETSP0272-20121206/66810_1 /TAXON_ID=71861 /ORGANISM="Scrippsiella trochoidea, Strain CCMP3099" /LENGTH=33 /DNA_ID= /DNA_START= /DNA_END= /DNA_ORIENTATION=